MKLEDIAKQLNKELDFPFMSIKKETGLTDNVYIVIALEPKEKWSHGYIENSRYLKAFIFCSGLESREEENSTYELSMVTNRTKVKIIQRKNLTGKKVLEYTLKQLKKVAEFI